MTPPCIRSPNITAYAWVQVFDALLCACSFVCTVLHSVTLCIFMIVCILSSVISVSQHSRPPYTVQLCCVQHVALCMGANKVACNVLSSVA